MTTHQIDVDVTFASPEAATLAFGLLHHATAAVAAGCHKQLVAGMESEDDAGEFLSKLLRESQTRDAILALTGRLMREMLAELATWLTVESSPTVDRTPAQVVRDGIRDKMHAAPPLEVIEAWTDAERDEVAGWLLDNRKCDGFSASTMPDALRKAFVGDGLPGYEPIFGSSPADSRAMLDKLNLEAVWTDGTLTYRERAAAVSDGPTVGEEVMGVTDTGVVLTATELAAGLAVDMARFEARSGHYLRATIDGEERRCREITVHELVDGPIVSIDDFTELCVLGNDPDTIEFYADGKDAEVDRVTLRIDGVDDDELDFSVGTNGQYNDAYRWKRIDEVGLVYPTCAPTLTAWQAGHTLPFRVVLKRARELAGLTEPLPEESEPSPADE